MAVLVSVRSADAQIWLKLMFASMSEECILGRPVLSEDPKSIPWTLKAHFHDARLKKACKHAELERTVFLRCSSSASPNVSNRRVRTRTRGGVAGVGG